MSDRLNDPAFLVSHWKLNGKAEDAIRKVNTVWDGTEDYADGAFGKRVAEMDGSTRIQVTDTIFPSGADPRTISMWVRFDTSGTTEGLFGYGSTVLNQEFSFSRAGSNLVYLYRWGVATQAIVTPLIGGKWWHFLVGFDGTGIFGYTNGKPDGYSAVPGVNTVLNAGNIARRLGAGASDSLDGKIANVRMYNILLTAIESNELFHLEHRL